MTKVKLSKSRKKFTTKINDKAVKESSRFTKEGKWILLYGGTDGERKSVADKAQYENLLEIKKKHEEVFKEKLILQHVKPLIARYEHLLKNMDKADKEQRKRLLKEKNKVVKEQREHLLKEMDEVDIKRMVEMNWRQMIRLRTDNRPSVIDLAGYDDAMAKKLLLGNIDDVDISENPFHWLKKTNGRLLNLYDLTGLSLHNLSCKHIETIKLIRTILKEIKLSTENTRTPYGMFVITLEDKKDLKKLTEGFTDLFEIAKIKTENTHGITNHRGRKAKHPKHDEFMKILDDILSDDKNDSLGGYVIKVKEQMEKQDLRKKNGDLIYTDKTIRTYIQRHPLYKKIQKLKQKRKRV